MNLNDIGLGIHVEITANCNSRCLDCGRYVKGTDTVNPYIDIGSKGNMSIDTIQNIFDERVSQRAKYFNLTGTYGDFILHPQSLEIVELVGDTCLQFAEQRRLNGLNPKVTLLAETNAGIRDDEYWERFADIILDKYDVKSSLVVFALDGTDNKTHQMYRRGVDFDTVLRHAAILINKGVRTRWSFISFDHNEHQIEEAQQMAKDIGFTQFRIRRSRLRHNPRAIKNITQKKKNISDKKLNTPELFKDIIQEVVDVAPAEKDVPKPWYKRKIDPYVNETSIECEWKKKKQISIDYTGRVWQCCYFSNFYHYNLDLGDSCLTDKYDFNDETRKYEKLDVYESRYAKNWNNVKYKKLSKILKHEFFANDLIESFNNTTDDPINPRIIRCSKFCGEKTRKIDAALQTAAKEKLKQ